MNTIRMTEEQYNTAKELDVLVVGAGPGGYVAAIRAAQLGLKVGIVEREYWGGVCLNVGCIPSKALLRNAELVHIFTHEKEEFGMSGEVHFDYTAAFKRSRKVSERLVKGVQFLMKKNKIEVFNGWATFEDAHSATIALNDGKSETVRFKFCIIATGATTRLIPNTQLSERVVTYPKSDKYLIFARRGVNIDDYPAIKAHLERYKDRLMPKPKGHVGAWSGRKAGDYTWYELQDNIAYWQEFEKPKIVWGNLNTKPSFTYDTLWHYILAPANIITCEKPLYVLGLLNSGVGNYFIGQIGATRQGGYIEYKPMYVSQFPIPRIDETKAEEVRLRDDIATHAEALLALHARLSALEAVQSDERAVLQADIARKDAQLDALVYALYGLSEADIAEMG